MPHIQATHLHQLVLREFPSLPTGHYLINSSTPPFACGQSPPDNWVHHPQVLQWASPGQSHPMSSSSPCWAYGTMPQYPGLAPPTPPQLTPYQPTPGVPSPLQMNIPFLSGEHRYDLRPSGQPHFNSSEETINMPRPATWGQPIAPIYAQELPANFRPEDGVQYQGQSLGPIMGHGPPSTPSSSRPKRHKPQKQKAYAVPSTPAPLTSGLFPARLGPNPEHLDAFNLGSRPRDWRPDYKPVRGFCFSRILSPFIGQSGAPYLYMNTKSSPAPASAKRSFSSIAPFFHYSPDHASVFWDLRTEPGPTTVHSTRLGGRILDELDISQLATEAQCIWIYHTDLPWYIIINAMRPNGITVGDVLSEIHSQLMEPIRQIHYWNSVLTSRDREVLGTAFEYRCKSDPSMVAKGICRVDFLSNAVYFVGLVKGKYGMWEMKTGAV